MEEIKRGRLQHGPIKYLTEEDRKEGIRKMLKKYLKKKEWFCDICPNHICKLANKWNHIQTQKHKKNAEKNKQ